MITEKKTEKIKKPRKKAPSRGGIREGAGRPKGSTNKISAQGILEALEHHLGVPYVDQLAMNYLDALQQGDRNIRAAYDRLFLGKVVADKVGPSASNKRASAASNSSDMELTKTSD